ncbi:sterol desaturase family protein [Sinorhizobium americanum]|uniref:Sterol desaturase/sphingolipid hydroxylase (Fatty acid hydroxylase superfamily) n=1 Tax=Sinorhizobium americanum TaxID=194963 RepID=A0A4R2C8U6_9HYPH|nr:sterol desaturase family protein [Sinorhizobium americanum]TCN36315.1 sterol desaturase/sphingolipid hydroxylase (fatty acid hydroxylase superfamily) [Sinorhizobium americanum]
MLFLGIAEPVWRLGAFAVVFAALAALELLHPRLERPELLRATKARRWATNLSILLLSSLLLRIVFPAAATGVAIWTGLRGAGLLPAIGVAAPLAGLVAFVALDFAVWLEHVVFHKLPILWRIHRVHHADPGVDVTTALRFHPLEILLSMAWKSAVIIALGAPALSVLIFEIVLNAAAMFNHANLRLPPKFDRALRLLIVTPDMHRIHHSVEKRETDSNYGFNLSLWDRLFSTYVARPASGDDWIETGLKAFGRSEPTKLLWSLMLPFRRG